MMTAPARRVTGGVDTHGDVHVAAVLDSATGRCLGVESFPAERAGYAALPAWLAGHGEVDAVGVESTGSWGAGLSRHLTAAGVGVIEVDRPDRKTRRQEGKSDPIDAQAAARAVLSGRATGTPKSGDGPVEAIRALEIVCHGATRDRTRAINQFKALLVTAPADLREHLAGLSFSRQLELARRFRDHDDIVEAQVRFALKTLARKITFLDQQINDLEARMNTLTGQAAPALAGTFGVGPHVAAQLLAALGDNPERISSEAAFAKLCAACPIPASSGKTTRHRLNPGGDRRANNALYTIVLVRMRHHAPTRAYVARRTAEGKTRLEIMRCLKRYVAREIFNVVTRPPAVPTGHDIRQRRLQAGITLTALANTLDIAPIRLSRLERGLDFNNDLATRAATWLTQNAA
ncbi:IS110 family transposase [Actinomarinicola tropica]|uniref:IS110 family transposase n=1 Tax=Actinomarinicola tropica TaxID=2789776 RepID=A0A5Q2RP95_9ACTN|nr:IS110 family transposase [Actinomarinicola tropica]